jgi:hypothetical protein
MYIELRTQIEARGSGAYLCSCTDCAAVHNMLLGTYLCSCTDCAAVQNMLLGTCLCSCTDCAAVQNMLLGTCLCSCTEHVGKQVATLNTERDNQLVIGYCCISFVVLHRFQASRADRTLTCSLHNPRAGTVSSRAQSTGLYSQPTCLYSQHTGLYSQQSRAVEVLSLHVMACAHEAFPPRHVLFFFITG